MDTQERVDRYEAGQSVSEIAKAAGVSRQAVLKTLKGAGVYTEGVTQVDQGVTQNGGGVTPDKGGVTLKKKGCNPGGVTQRKYCPLEKVPEGVSAPEKGWVYVARNLWLSKEGWLVRHYHGGEVHEERYKDRGAILARYPQKDWYATGLI